MAPLGTSPQFTATGVYMNGTMADITNDVTWASSNTAVATISNATGTQWPRHHRDNGHDHNHRHAWVR